MVKTGPTFADFIFLEKPRRQKSFLSIKNSSRDFFLIIAAVVFIGFLLVKLISLQVIEGERYRLLSNSNRIRTVVIHAPRGVIFDRNNTPLVFNIPGFRKVENNLPAGRQGKAKLLSSDEALKEIAKGEDLSFDSFRKYPYEETFSHVLGYIGQISENELREDRFSDYRGGDFIGKMGLEQYYEGFLRGTDGKELVEVDSKGMQVRKLGQTDPIPGKNITTTLDASLQKAAFSAIKNVKMGAVIVSNARGEILSLISKPSFDPNLFTLPPNLLASKSAQKELEEILFDAQGKPLLNRVVSGTYPPGSTFKLVVAASGLQNNLIDENFIVEDTGVINVGAFSFSNWYFTGYGKTEGPVNIVKGVKRSNDIFFYKLAEKVGVDKISEMAKKFGLGKPLGIDLANEASGLVPTSEWKQNTLHEPWFLGDTYHYGIGQGYLLTTPLQVNGWTQAIANGGTLYKPQLLKNSKFEVASRERNSKFLSDQTLKLIREGMIQSCTTGGVAWPLFEFKVKGKPVQIACKTGTAQHGDSNSEPHAWITLFAPAINPQIIVTVLAEDSGEGSNVAAPIAKKILEEWFSR